MVFYHGTSEDNWRIIQQDGVLYGRRFVLNNDGSIKKEVDRCTYLAVDKEEAEHYGDVVLRVEYDPLASKHNNYVEDCWQVRVYEPIPITQITRLPSPK